jgi:hypothetical protein
LIFRGRFVRPFPAAFRPVPQGIGLFLRGDGWHSGRSEESFFSRKALLFPSTAAWMAAFRSVSLPGCYFSNDLLSVCRKIPTFV